MKYAMKTLLAIMFLLTVLLTGGCGSPAEELPPAETTQPAAASPATEPATEAAEPTTAPTEPETYDYAVYPDPRAFIDSSQDNHYVWNTESYQYDTVNGIDEITGPTPYYWEQISFDPALDEHIWNYVKLLEEEPFDMELIYSSDMGDEWVYVFRYTGDYQVYPLNISGFIPEDAGEYHMAVDICKASRYNGSTGFEIAVGYGLEAIDPDVSQAIMDGEGYQRKNTHIEKLKPENPDQKFICYYCKKTVTPSDDTYMSDEQIIYCDDCYEDMFGEESSE